MAGPGLCVDGRISMNINRHGNDPRNRGLRNYGVLLLPAAVVLAVVFFYPLGLMFVQSLHQGDFGTEETAFTVSNYTQFISDPYYRRMAFNSISLGVLVSAMCLVLSYPLAYAIARAHPWQKVVLTVITLVPLLTSVVVRTLGWMILLRNNGLVTSVLDQLGIHAQLLYSFPGVLIALVEVLMPFMVLSLSASISSINPSIEDAAGSLGASRLRTFKDVVVPMSLPGAAAGSLLVFVLAVSAFATPDLIGGRTVKLVPVLVYEQATIVFNWPFAGAAAFILLALSLTAVSIQARVLDRQGS